MSDPDDEATYSGDATGQDEPHLEAPTMQADPEITGTVIKGSGEPVEGKFLVDGHWSHNEE